ncbi:MAG: flavodoxin-dependent (E)-4-hydroxy-3-methylbut-2-enyl-diphosphate synthase [Elusimicrobiota bacterium]
MFTRNNTRKIKIGKVVIGGGSRIAVQSMTNTDTKNVSATVNQIKQLEGLGCEIVRVAVPDMDAARRLGEIKRRINIPLVADIHFDYRLALEAINQGVDKLRINPGNIGSEEKVDAVVLAAKKAKIPIRIGVNAGSLKTVRGVHDAAKRAEKLVDSAIQHVKMLENRSFRDIVVSLKASDVATTVEAYKLFAAKRNYPLHLGITEAGSLFSGAIKSSVGMGIMLYVGLGDTIRVSLTSDPEEEVKASYKILQSLGLRSAGVEIISCPTCSRCEVNLIKIVNELEKELALITGSSELKSKKPIKVAVMGCVVNGPGEASEADIGIAGGKNTGILFSGGKVIGKVSPDKWVKTLKKLVIRKVKGLR